MCVGQLAGTQLENQFSFLCSTSSGGNVDVRELVWSHEPVGEPAENFTDEFYQQTPRLSMESNQLVFNAVEVSDDGLYVCYYSLGTDTNFIRRDVGCVYVFGELE